MEGRGREPCEFLGRIYMQHIYGEEKTGSPAVAFQNWSQNLTFRILKMYHQNCTVLMMGEMRFDQIILQVLASVDCCWSDTDGYCRIFGSLWPLILRGPGMLRGHSFKLWKTHSCRLLQRAQCGFPLGPGQEAPDGANGCGWTVDGDRPSPAHSSGAQQPAVAATCCQARLKVPVWFTRPLTTWVQHSLYPCLITEILGRVSLSVPP